MSNRKISIIIVPPGGGRTVQRSISVFRAKLLLAFAGASVLMLLGTAGIGLSLWTTAAGGRALETENDSLRVAVSRMIDLEGRLVDLERTGGQIRSLLAVNDGVESPAQDKPTRTLHGELDAAIQQGALDSR